MKYMRGNIAEDFFKRGFNCSQAVVLAYNDYIQMEGVQLLKFTLPLGAGLGRLRLTCGAVVGMSIVCGYIVGKNDPSDENKNKVYEAVREVVHRFEEKYTTITCKELLESKDVIAKIGGNPDPRTVEYYTARPCAAFVHDAAEILEEYLLDNNYID
jgi:C_GCAxxG_C_C family probable redox protein